MKVQPKKQSVKLKIKSGDTVEIIAGKDKGERGRVIRVIPKKMQVLLEGLSKDNEGKAMPLNAVTKHRKARMANEKSERVRMAAPLHISKVMLVDPHSDKPTRVGRRVEDGKLIRYAKSTNDPIDVD